MTAVLCRMTLVTLGDGMDTKELDRLAKELFEKENSPTEITWNSVARERVLGQTVIPGAGEAMREEYRTRVLNGER